MKCLNCQSPLKNKRSDSLYCNTKCRVEYNRNRNKNNTIKNADKTILSLCDYSGTWSDPYLQAGYNVIRIDLKNGDDVRLLKHPGDIYGILAAPPCDHLAVSGSRFWDEKGNGPLLDGLSIFDACCRIVLFSCPEFWVFENPVGRLVHYIGKSKWIFDPCDYGDPYTKKTCLWGKFNVPAPRNKVEPRKAPSGHQSIQKYILKKGLTLGSKRKERRSETPAGFAKAFFESNR